MPLLKPRNLSYQFEKLGSDATLRTWTEGAPDTYGDTTYVATDQTLTVIKSYTTNTRMPFIRRGELGNYLMMQVEFFTMDEVDCTIITPPNTAVDKPPVLIHASLEYEIMETEDSGIGVIRFITYRTRED